jgi:hypothetical protein
MLPHIAVTLPDGPATTSGVPLGRLLPAPVEMTRGWPFEVTRVVPVTHMAAMHGGSGGGTSGQPATTHCAFSSTVGVPPTVTLGLGDVAIACPPWLHMTVAPTGNKYPPMTCLRYYGADAQSSNLTNQNGEIFAPRRTLGG